MLWFYHCRQEKDRVGNIRSRISIVGLDIDWAFPFFIGKSNSILDDRKAKIWPSYLVESLVFATPGMAASHWIKVPQSVCDFAKTSIPVLAIHDDDDGLYWLFGGLLYMAFIFFLEETCKRTKKLGFFFFLLFFWQKLKFWMQFYFCQIQKQFYFWSEIVEVLCNWP